MVAPGFVDMMGQTATPLMEATIEHPAVLNPCLFLLEEGWDVTFVRVDGQGLVDPHQGRHLLAADLGGLLPVEDHLLEPVTDIANLELGRIGRWRLVEQRVAFAPRVIAVHESNVTVVESPAARLVTLWVSAYAPMRRTAEKVSAFVP